MGADLYMDRKFKKNTKKYSHLFHKWVEKRDEAKSSEERDEAQEKVSHYHDKMYSEGYFRDSYNDTSLFWKLDLSWWQDIPKFLDKNGDLTPKKAEKLLEVVKSRRPTFEENLNKIDFSKWEDSTEDEIREYFEKKYKTFISFLEEAIKDKQKISCSI